MGCRTSCGPGLRSEASAHDESVAIKRARRSFWVVLGMVNLAGVVGCDPIHLDFESDKPGPLGLGPGGMTSVPEPPPAPELIVDEDANLGRQTPSGRSCTSGGEMATYPVKSAQGTTLTLDRSPQEECLLPGDEILLIELQAAARERVGRHELLRVLSVDDAQVTLVSRPLQQYGAGSAGSWTATDAQVVVQRVPSFSRLTVTAGAALTAPAWREGGSGVLALRVLGDLRLDGRITMSEAGFSGGAARTGVLETGLQGESIVGLGGPFIEPNVGGGGGGLGDQMREACVQDGNAGGGGGHAQPGQDAIVDDLCAGEGRGRGGLAYAAEGKLFLGSGGGSGGVDNVRVDNPPGAPGGNGGGMIWILAQSVTGIGSIEARGGDGVGDDAGVECVAGGSQTSCYDHSGPGGGGAGGSIRLTTTQLSGVDLDVSGGRGGNGWDEATGNGGDGAPGVIEAPLSE